MMHGFEGLFPVVNKWYGWHCVCVCQAASLKQGKKGKKEGQSVKGIMDKLDMLDLHQMIIQQGLFIGEPYWGDLDSIVVVFLAAVIIAFYSIMYRLSHPGEVMMGTGSMMVLAATSVPLNGLIAVVRSRGWWSMADGKYAFICGGLSVVVSSMIMILPKGTLTFDMDAAFKSLNDELILACNYFGLKTAADIDVSGALRAVIVILSALLVTGQTLPSARFSTILIHPGWRSKEYKAGPRLVTIELILTFVLFFSFLRRYTLEVLQSPAFVPCTTASEDCNKQLPAILSYFLPPTEDSWLKSQCLLTLMIVALRLSQLRLHLRFFLDYQTIEALAQDLMKKDMSAMEIRAKLTFRFRYAVLVALEYLAPVFWLCTLVLQVASSYLIPLLLIQYVSTRDPELAEKLQKVGMRHHSGKDEGFPLAAALQAKQITAKTVKELVLAVSDVVILRPEFYKHICSYFLFWSVFSWIAGYFFALLYHMVTIPGFQVNLPATSKKDR